MLSGCFLLLTLTVYGLNFLKVGSRENFLFIFCPYSVFMLSDCFLLLTLTVYGLDFLKMGSREKIFIFFARAKRSSQPYILFGVCIGRDGSIDRAARILRDGSVSRIGGVARFGGSGDYVVNRNVRAADYDRDAML